ncbi:hypothetical protein [Pelotomaculum sp. PtaB.Bin117]|uniref:hypothetical protein n=1 Tax=Pelotomaculum sp. PtaB.Bin117 TaxID=1811694 RepID=UPI00257DC2A6|nr:hypothetical protein [Pelotomaculum sp. PtaB.Bin117]
MRLKPYCSEKFPWDDVMLLLNKHSKHKTENKEIKPKVNTLPPIDLSKTKTRKANRNPDAAKKQENHLVSDNINNKTTFFRLIENINSPEDFIFRSENIFSGLQLLKASRNI